MMTRQYLREVDGRSVPSSTLWIRFSQYLVKHRNAQRSWACVRRRQHCFRNLDVDYLTIKAFLLERFLHDALYEAPTAEVFNEFLDIRPAPAAQVSFASSPSLPRSAVSGSLSR